MSKQKTHYRKAFKSPYLSSSDIVEPLTLTIKAVRLEPDRTKKSKEHFNTAYFEEKEIRRGEPMKPMVLNVGNTEVIRKMAGGAKYLDDWILGFKVQVFVLEGVKFGRDTVEGLRIGAPPQRRQIVEGTQQWSNAIEAYKRDNNLDAVKSRVDVSPAQEALIIEAAKSVV